MREVVLYKNVDIGYEEKVVLRDVDFIINRGEFVFVTGEVGSGKTTFLRSLYAEADILRAEKAEVLGFNLLKLKRRHIPKLRRNIGYVFQDFKLLNDRSVYANLEFVLRAIGWKNDLRIKRRIEQVLEEVKMQDYIDAMPYELSGGQTQKIAIARALLNEPPLILADEPTGNLDYSTGYHIINTLYQLRQKSIAIIVVTHNIQWLQEFKADRHYVVEDRTFHLVNNS